MYKCYNVKINDDIIGYSDNDVVTSSEDRSNILNFFDKDGVLIAKDIIEEWFPNKKFDIFISHSHRDKSKALSLSSYLYEELGLNCFIDSTVWGYVNEILNQIDQSFCKNKEKSKDGHISYDYSMRNISTAHVHNMLSVALSKMMEQCECLFFLNTENSIISNENIKTSNANETYSCWIYYELSIRKLLRITLPDRLESSMSLENLQETKAAIVADAAPIVRYGIDIADMRTITASEIEKWVNRSSTRGEAALDTLYKMYKTPI